MCHQLHIEAEKQSKAEQKINQTYAKHEQHTLQQA